MRLEEDYGGGKLSPLENCLRRDFKMRRVIAPFLFAVCTSTPLWAQEVKPSWPHSIGIEMGSHQWISHGIPGRGRRYAHHSSARVDGDYRIWNAQFGVFSASYRVVAVNLRHFYPERWDGIGTDFSIEQHAQDVTSLIKKLNLGKVHLIGHSRAARLSLRLRSRIRSHSKRWCCRMPASRCQCPRPPRQKRLASSRKSSSGHCRKT